VALLLALVVKRAMSSLPGPTHVLFATAAGLTVDPGSQDATRGLALAPRPPCHPGFLVLDPL